MFKAKRQDVGRTLDYVFGEISVLSSKSFAQNTLQSMLFFFLGNSGHHFLLVKYFVILKCEVLHNLHFYAIVTHVVLFRIPHHRCESLCAS